METLVRGMAWDSSGSTPEVSSPPAADDLKAKAIGALRRLQKLPGTVRGFLRDPKLAYILELHKRTAREVYKLIFSLVAGLGIAADRSGIPQAVASREA